MTPEEVTRHFEDSGALLSGHFRLSSGLHSDRYLQCAKVLQWPARAEALGAALAAKLRDLGPRVVLSPAMGGLIIGHETGRGLGTRAVFAERVEGSFVLRRGFFLQEDETVAVVEDVVTTGKSTREVIELVAAAGARTVVCASIVDRRAGGASLEDGIDGIPLRSLLSLAIAAYSEKDCPMCTRGETVTAPGSRFLAPARF